MLPNVWDAGSARAVEAAGFAVVATSSAAVAGDMGQEDGRLSASTMLAVVTQVARAVSVPVTADLEHGYGLAPTELVRGLAATGAVGCNLEDSDPTTGELVDRSQPDFLADVRAAAVDSGLDLVINARIDTDPHAVVSPTRQLADCIRRARLYFDAGVDCVFPSCSPTPAPSAVSSSA